MVKVEDGMIEWVDKEPTPDPEQITQEALKRIEEKLDLVISNQKKMEEEITKLKEGKKQETKGPKTSKRNPNNKANKD